MLPMKDRRSMSATSDVEDAVRKGQSRRGVSVVADFVRMQEEETDGSWWQRWKQKARLKKSLL